MLSRLKKRLYFIVAAYFAFWAKFVLLRWKPRVIVITGSAGKTTALHLVEAQLGNKAEYTHHANSAIGIPFYLLGLPKNMTSKGMWLGQVIKAPFKIFRKTPFNQLLIVEADCDRPLEGRFLSKLLKPEVTLWISVHRTHSMNFDRLVPKSFPTHEAAIAYEFGYFIANTQKLAIINADLLDAVKQLDRVPNKTEIVKASIKKVSGYELTDNITRYEIGATKFSLPGIHPRELGVSLQMVQALMDYLKQPLDPNFKKLEMPPGRSSSFKGKNNTVLIDSTYNTGLGAMIAVLDLFGQYKHEPKWLVIGDILEQGSVEQEEHEKLAQAIEKVDAAQIILIGPRTKKHTYPRLDESKTPVVSFERPDEVLRYLNENLKGGEAILFKGGRYLEGVIEQLLADPNDAKNLVRRGVKWEKTRQKWGLPK